MDFSIGLIGFALLIGFYMAWNIGANDVANAMGTSVGSGALTLRRAVIIAAIVEFAGAVLLGSHVSATMQNGIVDPSAFSQEPRLFAYGMLAALLSAGIWLQIASYFGWPVSTTHSIVGAIIGFGSVFGSMKAVRWSVCNSIFLSWLISPLAGALGAYLIFSFLRRFILYSDKPLRKTKQITPWIAFVMLLTLGLFILCDGLRSFHIELTFPEALLIALAISSCGAIATHFMVQRIKAQMGIPTSSGDKRNNETIRNVQKALFYLEKASASSEEQVKYQLSLLHDDMQLLSKSLGAPEPATPSQPQALQLVEKIFAYLQIFTACFMAFAHGANDVANAIGPLAAVVSTFQTGFVTTQAVTPLWLLVLGGVGIVTGLATWGWRVIDTIGKKITALDPTRGFAAEFGAALTIVIASKLGMPISTTHTLVGALLGIGLARGLSALNLRTIREIIISWLVTVPIGGLLCIAFTYGFKFILG